MSNDVISLLLAENKAYWYKDSSSLVLLPDGYITREWRNIPVEHRNACIATLRSRRQEVNPSAQQVPYNGTYRITKVEDVVEKDTSGRMSSITIREYLASGLATSLSDATAVPSRVKEWSALPGGPATQAVSPAHPLATSSVQQPYESIILRWENLDPNALETIDASRTSFSESAITVNGESMSGPWYNTSRRRGQLEDGSGFYEETWGFAGVAFESSEKVGDMSVVANRVIQNVPKNMVKATLDSEISALSSTYGAAGYIYRQRIRWREETADLELDAVRNISKTDSHTSEDSDTESIVRDVVKTAASLPDAPSSTQGVVSSIRGDIGSDGTVDYVQEVKTSKVQEILEHISNLAYDGTEYRTVGRNLRDADLPDYEPLTQEQGHVKRLEKSMNADGTYDEVLVDRVSTDQTASTDATHSDQHRESDASTEDSVIHTAASAPLADVAFSTQGTITETNSTPKDDGTYRTESKTVVSKEQTILDFVASEDKFKQVQSDIGKQIKDATLTSSFAISATTGEVQSRRISENADGTYDVQLDRDIAKTVAQSTMASEISQFEKKTTEQDRNNESGDTPPLTQTAGTIVGVTNRLNEYNRYDVSVETRTAISITDSQKQKEISKYETQAKEEDRHQVDPVTEEVAQTVGQIVQTTSEKDEFARFTNTTVTRVATSVSTADKRTSATTFEKDSEVTDRNQLVAATPITSQTAGTIVTARASLNEFSMYDNTVDTKTAIEVDNVVKSKEIDLFKTESRAENRHKASAVAEEVSQTAGQIVRTTSEKDEYGLYTNATDTRVATAVDDTQKLKEINLFEVQAKVEDRHQVEAVAEEVSQTAGQIVRTTSEKDEFGRFTNSTDTRTATSVSDAQKSKEISLYETQAKVEDRHQINAVAEEVSQTSGKIVRTTSEKDEFGRYTNVTDTRTSTAIADSDKKTSAAAFSSDSEVTNRNQTSAASPITVQTPGTIVTARSVKNDFSKYDTTVDTKTAITVEDAEVTTEYRSTSHITSVLDRNETTAETPPVSQTAGIIKTVKSVLNDFGRYDNLIETKTANDGGDGNGVTEGGERVATSNSILTGTSKANIVAANVPAQPDFTTGQIDVQRKRLNEYGSWDVESSTDVATYVYDSGTYATKEGTVSWWWGINATVSQYNAVVATAALTGSSDNSLSKTINRYGLIDYVIRKHPTGGMFYLWGESTGASRTRESREYAKLYSSSAGRERRYYRDVVYAYTLNVRNSFATAQLDVDGGKDGSAVHAYGSGRYASFVVTSITPGDWTLDEAGVT